MEFIGGSPLNIKIVNAENKHLTDCKIALQKSELGRVYFPNEDKVHNALNEGISKGEISVAINEESVVMGFVWVIQKGAFHSYPYVHIIAVKEEYRSLGIGKRLIGYIEENSWSSKLFLVVADFNPRAKKFYLDYGFKEVGCIPNLYRNGITEYLLVKEILK